MKASPLNAAEPVKAESDSKRKILLQDLLFLLKTSRPGFWLTAIWFYLLPVSQQHVLGSSRFWLGLLFVTFPFGLLIYGWNDLMDVEIDRINARKDTFLFGARGTDAQLQKLPWAIALVQCVFAAIFVWLEGWSILLWYLALVAAVALYNAPKIGFKNYPVVDMVNQLGYVLVFYLSSALNQVPQLPWATYLFGGLFAMHSHLLGEIMDLEVDRVGGRRTTAVVVGAIPAKFVIVTMLLLESGLVLYFFKDQVVGWFLCLGAGWFAADALVIFKGRAYPLWLTRWFLTAWNIMAIGSAWWVWSHGALSRLR